MTRLGTLIDVAVFGLACIAIGVKLGERAFARHFADEIDSEVREKFYNGHA